MGLFEITAWARDAEDSGSPFWETSIYADNIEEAYRIGANQFATEHPQLDSKLFTIKAASGQVEK